MGLRTIGDWENGKTTPSIQKLAQLARGLQVPVKEVLSSFDVDISNIPDDLPEEVISLLIELPGLLKFSELQTQDELMSTKIKLARLKIEKILKNQNKGAN